MAAWIILSVPPKKKKGEEEKSAPWETQTSSARDSAGSCWTRMRAEADGALKSELRAKFSRNTRAWLEEDEGPSGRLVPAIRLQSSSTPAKNVINYSMGRFFYFILYIKNNILWRLVASRYIRWEKTAGKFVDCQKAIWGVGLKLGLTRLRPFSWGFISSTQRFGPV